jgi:hypothetical protein
MVAAGSGVTEANSISIGIPRKSLAGLLALLSIVLLLSYWHATPKPKFPKILEGWQLKQPADIPFFGSNSRFTNAPAAAEQQTSSSKPGSLGPLTDAPMKVLPPFEPTCIADDLHRMETWGCPVIFCSLDPSCTIHNTSCCAYLNFKMLSFLHDFLASKCLQDEYLTMFGTGLGAVRNQTIIPWTEVMVHC